MAESLDGISSPERIMMPPPVMMNVEIHGLLRFWPVLYGRRCNILLLNADSSLMFSSKAPIKSWTPQIQAYFRAHWRVEDE